VIVRCTWERTGGGYRAWAVEWPQDTVESSDWREIEVALFDRVLARIDGCEWTADWDPAPPLPVGFPGRELENFVRMGCDGAAAILSDPLWLYTEGLCMGCESPRGARTDARAHVHLDDPGELMCATFSRPLGVLFCTGVMLEMLPIGIRNTAEFRRCERVSARKGASEVYEILPERTVPWVAARELSSSGWGCGICGARCYHQGTGIDRFQFVAEREVPGSADCFWVGSVFAPDLCVAASNRHTAAASRP
jgi:hypothetical protein